jgi:WD40 repeat protein
MAIIFRGQGRAIATSFALLSFVMCVSRETAAELYDRPVLVIDPGMHTAPANSLGIDALGRIAVSGSNDKTVRVWSLAEGKLLRTIRMPAGPANIGKIYSVATNPDGSIIAAGGWTQFTAKTEDELLYLFDTNTGAMVKRYSVGPANVESLAFSKDGRFLASGLSGGTGLRVYDRDQQWNEIFHDEDYEESIYGVNFSAKNQLAASSIDGKVRLYDVKTGKIVRSTTIAVQNDPHRIIFSPDGNTIAIGFNHEPRVELLDANTLASLPVPDLDGLNGGMLTQVAFSYDGSTLYAGGSGILAWSNGGRGVRRLLRIRGDTTVRSDTIGDIAALPDGGLLVATQNPFVAVFNPDDSLRWFNGSPKLDVRDQASTLAVSEDGTIIDFGYEAGGKSPLRFNVSRLELSSDPPKDHQTSSAMQVGIAVTGWEGRLPRLSGKFIQLEKGEVSRSFAVHPDARRFILGAEWNLRALDIKGNTLWKRGVPGTVWAVNISADGKLVIAAYGDGTIRWHRMDDGRELLALFVLKDKQNWVAWTPEGFYGATPGAFGILRWHVNHGFDAVAEAVPVSAIPRLRRPDALPLVLQEMETARALGLADLKAARRDVQIATKSAKAPGARLHVLTVGVSDYGDKARDLRLKFAGRDAEDVASALANTQEGGLYAQVEVQYLRDGTANKNGIFDALAALERNLEKSLGEDLAVIMFSGHGTVIDGQFYLIPFGADDSTPTRVQSSAISAIDFQRMISKIASHGRVLVLLDACRSAGLIGTAVPGADMLRSMMAASNVTVLTSSMADKLSREDEKWQHGAFTKALLDALGSGDDIDADRNGVISMAELTAYLARHLDELTNGDQQLGLEQRFQGDVFVSGL